MLARLKKWKKIIMRNQTCNLYYPYAKQLHKEGVQHISVDWTIFGSYMENPSS